MFWTCLCNNYSNVFYKPPNDTSQARWGQLKLAAVYFGVLQSQTAAFSGRHLRQWRITITTMTGLTGASEGGEGKESRVRAAVRRGCGGRRRRGACERGTSSAGRPRSSSRCDEWGPATKLSPHGLHVSQPTRRFRARRRYVKPRCSFIVTEYGYWCHHRFEWSVRRRVLAQGLDQGSDSRLYYSAVFKPTALLLMSGTLLISTTSIFLLVHCCKVIVWSASGCRWNPVHMEMITSTQVSVQPLLTLFSGQQHKSKS